MVCFSKKRQGQETITEIKFYEDWNAEVCRNVYNKKSTGTISSIYEDKQELNTNTKKRNQKKLKAILRK